MSLPRSPGGDEIVGAPRVTFRMPRPGGGRVTSGKLRLERKVDHHEYVPSAPQPSDLVGGSPLKQNIFEQAFIWFPIRHSSPNTPRNKQLLNSSEFSETPCTLRVKYTSPFRHPSRHKGGGVMRPLRIWLLIELELIKTACCLSRDEAGDTRVHLVPDSTLSPNTPRKYTTSKFV